MIEPRDQIHECYTRLHQARSEVSIDTLERLITFELGVLDARLRKCTKDELERLQGEVAVWVKLQKNIVEGPHSGRPLT
jgi:hypothetical protein